MELGERKQRILAAIIDEYIRTGEPVGSKVVVEHLNQAVSSATVRNDMADLAALGYLDQPHTSAGRVPTAPAFRLYIDHLMHRKPLAEATGCAAVSTSPYEQEACIRRIEVMPMEGRSLALLLMTGSGTLRSRVCRTPHRLDTDGIRLIARALNDNFLGQPVSSIGLADVQGLLWSLGEYSLIAAPVLTGFYELVQEAAAADILLTGQLNLLQHPDYGLNHAKELLHFLGRRDLVADMLTAFPGGLKVVLGNESDRPELVGSSIIVTRYTLGDGSTGTIGLIGPLRMDYASAIPRLEYFANSVGRLLTELLDE